MKRSLIYLFVLFSYSLTGQIKDTLQRFQLQPKQMLEDFTLLRRALTETHPGLYRYSSKEKMNAEMDSIQSLLTSPMFFYDFHFLLTRLISDIRCAHTYAIPLKNLEAYYLDRIETFPLMPFFVSGKFYITVNGTANESIQPGFELLSINGRPITEIRDQMFQHIWADGYNTTLKLKTMSEAYFPLFYYLSIERPKTFLVKMKNLSGQEVEVTVPAQTFRTTKSFFTKNKVNKEIITMATARNKVEQKKGWRLTIKENESTGIIRINGFGGGNNEEAARKKMHVFLDDCMTKLQAKNIQNLIIDLRYNGGGWDVQGMELYTFLMSSPARCYRRLHSVTDSSEFFKYADVSPEDLKKVKSQLKKEPDGTFTALEEFNEDVKIQQPQPNRFRGPVYVLANGGSGSTTSEFIAYAKSANAITLIGDETGGAYEGSNGGSFLHFDLPHSKISIGTPLLYYDNEVKPIAEKGFGTKPDYYVPYKVDEMLKGIDTQLNFALELIKKQGNH